MQRRSAQSMGFNSITVLIIATVIITVVVIGRLFYLQVIKYGYYQETAARAHQGYTELPAKRGEILVKDYMSGESFVVASNTTLELVYVDPKLIPNKTLVATTLAEILFDLYAEKEKDNQRIIREKREFKRTGNIDAYGRVKPLTDEELRDAFYHEIFEKVSRETREQILLSSSLPEEILDDIDKKNYSGIEVRGGSLFAYPKQIRDKRYVAKMLSDDLNIAPARLEQILLGSNRYEVIAQKVDPEKTRQIREAMQEDRKQNPGEGNYSGVGFKEEYYRFYPEAQFAANLLGFVDRESDGQYGIEETFDRELRGKMGIFKAQRDSIGRQITVGDSVIQPAVNGQSITLTIDRTIQLEAERIIEAGVKKYGADSGQILILDPKTSKVMAMAHYPSFDPNNYGAAFNRVDIDLSEEDLGSLVSIDESDTNFYFYRSWDSNDRFQVFKDEEEGKASVYQRYANWVGAEAYQNKAALSIYEPGSVFKSIVMASAIDDGDVTPNTVYYENGPIKVDEFEIRNSTNTYRGRQTMTNVLEQSSNIGMAFVARAMGRNLFYSYLIKFGFGEKTGIEFDNEPTGYVEYFTGWAESELVTRAFGQGITVTPLQLTNAYAALANKGLLMQPYIIESIADASGKTIYTQPKVINQVISEDTANKITAMLVSTIENGVAPHARVKDHYIAGKTGTAQTYKHGKPLTGPGTTIASIAGYAPIDDPKFVLLIKLDKPRTSVWGAETAAPLFGEMASFLFDYYNVPPDKR